MPSSLVVKNGVNNWLATSGEIPSPWSMTANSTQALAALDAAGRTRSVKTLAADAPSACMACMPLRARFSSTCSTMVRSQSTGLALASTCITTVTDSFRACRLTRGITASSSSRGVMASRAWSRRRTKSCTLLITLPARSACSAMRLMASCKSVASTALGG